MLLFCYTEDQTQGCPKAFIATEGVLEIISHLWPYHLELAGSNLILEAKQGWTRFVLGRTGEIISQAREVAQQEKE